jgi:hypothetical protein
MVLRATTVHNLNNAPHSRNRVAAVSRCALVFSIAAMLGCASRPATSASSTPAADGKGLLVRTPSFADTELAARQLGRLEVAVRAVERPTQSLEGAIVTVQGLETEIRATADRNGVARFDSLAVGAYRVSLRRLGYSPTTLLAVPVRAGCRTDLEIYLSMMMVGIAPPPSMAVRSTITTCGG